MPRTKPEIYEFSQEELTVERPRALAAAGYPEGVDPPERILASLLGAEETLRGLMRPRALVRRAGLLFRGGDEPGFGMDPGPFFASRLVSAPLSAARDWAFFVLTIGGRASLISAEKRDADFLGSFLLDAMASVFAEALADLLQERLGREAAERGWVTGWRFSPGYCDWALADNRELLAVLDAGRIGIRLTNGGMMVPEKSVSGVMGFGPPGTGVTKSPCAACGNKSCNHRRGSRKK